MEIILKARASGKTRLAIEWLRANPNGILVTFSHGEEMRLKSQLQEKEPHVAARIVHWVCAKEITPQFYPRIEKLFVDNLDLIVSSLFREPIEACTLTKPDQAPQVSAKGLRAQFELDLAQLQAKCTHPTTVLCEQSWAPGHFSGNQVEVCNFCEKEIQIIPYEKRKEPPFYERDSARNQDLDSED